MLSGARGHRDHYLRSQTRRSATRARSSLMEMAAASRVASDRYVHRDETGLVAPRSCAADWLAAEHQARARAKACRAGHAGLGKWIAQRIHRLRIAARGI